MSAVARKERKPRIPLAVLAAAAVMIAMPFVKQILTGKPAAPGEQ